MRGEQSKGINMKMEQIKRCLEQLIRWILRIFMIVCRVFPVVPNKVVVLNFRGKGFGDNGKGIALQLMKTAPGVDIVWAVSGAAAAASLPEGIRSVKLCSLRYYWEMATAGVWVDNCRKGRSISKRKGQFYIQTWHGATGCKKVERDVQDKLSPDYVANAKYDSQMADVILSGSRFFTELCRRAFWYDGRILEFGTPRLDVLFHQTEEENRRVKQSLGIAQKDKVLLYVPTFRADGNVACYIQEYDRLLAALREKTGDNWVALVRLHPNVADKAGFISYSDKVINATGYPDLYELIPVADVVISDYSSAIFDAAIVNKTGFLYATDLQAYRADRDFYIDIPELPFPFAESMDELIENIRGFDPQHYRENLEKFNQRIGYFESGNASEAVVEEIMKAMKHER